MTDIRGSSPPAFPAITASTTPADLENTQLQDSLGAKALSQHQTIPENILKEIGNLSGTLDQILNMGKAAVVQQAVAKNGLSTAITSTPPSLSSPMMEFSAEDMALILTGIKNKTSEVQILNAKEGLTITKKKMDDLNANALDKIKTMIEAAEKTAKADKANLIMGWLGKVGGFLGAVLGVVLATAATIGTGGAAAPLLVLAAAGMVGATFALAGQISTATGGPPLDLASLAKLVVSKILNAAIDGMADAKGLKGSDRAAFKESNEKFVTGFSQIIAGVAACSSLAVMATEPALIGNMVGGIAMLAGADEAKVAIIAASSTAATALVVAACTVVIAVATGGAAAGAAISGAMRAVTAVGQVVQAGMAIAQGALSISQGGVSIVKAKEQHKGDMAMVDKKTISAILVKLQKEMEEGKDEIKKVIDEIMESINLVSQMINSGAQNRAQINSNMGDGRMNTI